MNRRDLKRTLSAVMAPWCVVIAAACSSSAPGAGTNTNWIKCTTDVGCAATATPATCVSGVCRTADGKAALAASKPEACVMPSPDAGASGRAACQMSRAYVTCMNPDGSGSSCTTDGAITCEGATGTCQGECAATEYVAACGGVGPGPVPDPPAGCHFVAAFPAGVAFYCCPCGS